MAAAELTLQDVYVAAFTARCAAMRREGQELLDEPGIRGLLPTAEAPLARLLITDDRPHPTLAALLPELSAGMVKVLATAEQCADLLRGAPAWRVTPLTAMVCRDLERVPELTLPAELTFRPVRRLAGDDPAGVPLAAAVDTVMHADPSLAGHSAQELDGFLRALPAPFRLFAAVEAGGAVRATSGAGAFGAQADVLFVNTDHGWRGRGIARAMTAAALADARARGASRACLDATDAAASIYGHLGFAVVSPLTQFYRAG
ncbi:MAG TPA: GNAT family N-acetyltransferase [Solirubrobacteraceae bacterium]|jgi:GNAT superfamily N-acetyltransferase